MIPSHPEYVREKMNECGMERRPFLFVVNFELTEGYLIERPDQSRKLFYSVLGSGNKPVCHLNRRSGFLNVYPVHPEEYRNKYKVVIKSILRGDSYLTNLTVRTPIACPLSMEDIFLLSSSPYQLYIPGKFVCFSPERFIKITAGRISTNPMKGTIDAAMPEAERLILNDFKEIAEHNTIVDLLRNDISIWAEQVQVKRFRYIDRIKTRQREILQVSSEITGKLPQDYLEHLGDIVFAMLPAGSCSGAPKRTTVAVIREAEGEPRGYYTGIFGLFDGRDFDSAVMIRFIEETNGQKYFRSGGGVTAYSVWKDEYREVLEKIYLPFL